MSIELAKIEVYDLPELDRNLPESNDGIKLSTIDVYGTSLSKQEVPQSKVQTLSEKVFEHIKDYAEYGPMSRVSPEAYEEIMKLAWTNTLAAHVPSMAGAMAHHQHFI